MSPKRFIKMTGFIIQDISESIPQDQTIDMLVYALSQFAIAQSNDAKTSLEVYSEVADHVKRYALSSSKIKQRQLVGISRALNNIENIQENISELLFRYLFEGGKNLQGEDIAYRQIIFGNIVRACLDKLYNKDTNPPTDIIHVTCSGYLAPNPISQMVSRNHWFNTRVTNIYHMGCYAAFPAIRTAHGFLSSSNYLEEAPRNIVDIVHTEISSLHHNITDLSASNIIVASLFSDGFIKYSLVWDNEYSNLCQPALKILALHEHLLPNSSDDMTHHPGPFQFLMTLTGLVPAIIKRHVVEFVNTLLHLGRIEFSIEKGSIIYAIHPGGPKIVEHIQQVLDLSECQVQHSKFIFMQHGNMSSATIPHIFKSILEDENVAKRTIIVALAFGPGLTVTGALLEKV